MTKKKNNSNKFTFSNPGIEGISCCKDFDIYCRDNDKICKWTIDDGDLVDPPPELIKYVKDYFKFSTNRLEKSRRFIIMAFILSAISKINETEECDIVIDEEKKLSTTIKNNEYTGNIDFVIGHSKYDDRIPDDSCIVVLEAKIPGTFDKSLGQLMAQAATTMRIRNQSSDANNEKPIFMIRTDGNNWQFGTLRLMTKIDTKSGSGYTRGETFIAQLSEKLRILPESKYDVHIKEIFSWMYMILRKMYVLTPRLNKKLGSLSISSESSQQESLEVKTATNEDIVPNIPFTK